MIDVKDDVNMASAHLVDLLGANAISDIRLEEVELAHRGEWIDDKTPDAVLPEDADVWDKSYWLITLSFLPKTPNPLIAESSQRQYKLFKLAAETGDLVAMKMRKVA